MSTFIQYPVMEGKYRHYKGGLYEVITLATSPESKESIDIHIALGCNSNYKGFQDSAYRVRTMATHSETDERLVVYESLAFGTVYVMPLALWMDYSFLTTPPSEVKEQLVIYKSLLFGSVHARPLSMWFEKIANSTLTRFEREY